MTQKKREYKDTEIEYLGTISLLNKEKEVLSEKLSNSQSQTKELEDNLSLEKEENKIKINQLKKEHKNRLDQIQNENLAIKNKLKQNEVEYKELQNNYEKDISLWNNKAKHLTEEKENSLKELKDFKNKYNQNVEDLQSKVVSEREKLDEIYSNAINKREKDFNNQLIKANNLFSEKFVKLNELNHKLTLENKELIDKLNHYQNDNETTKKQEQYLISKENTERIKKEFTEVVKNKDAEIEELNGLLLKERREYTMKIIQLEKKLREYESKRKNYAIDMVKQKSFGAKDKDDQSIQIENLRNKISDIEKSNSKLYSENREHLKEIDSIKRRNNSLLHNTINNFIPKNKLFYNNKDSMRSSNANQIDIPDFNNKNSIVSNENQNYLNTQNQDS